MPAPTGVVRFRAYRQYEALRVEASNALMGLLAGAQLSNHLLQLNRGSDRLLPEVYPNVPHIKRFNLTAEAASDILGEADVHLGAMSIAYALALHEDYMKTCLLMAADAGLLSRRRARDARSAGQHEALQLAAGAQLHPVPLEQLTVLRRMRNAVIHDGGRIDDGLVTTIDGLSPEAISAWTKVTGTDPTSLRAGQKLRLGHGEMLLALAVTKNVDRGCNGLLQVGMSRNEWTRVAVDDALEEHPGSLRAGTALRKCHGVARHLYGPLNLSRTEIAAELDRRGPL
ncbi:hypothetical protein [Curtobacterium sp. VKM Ac-1393]|uniref:hypothetical protein n=1 Tax=Curtobacterium sp. VKM Ac-1393 TaxID=2783814 RepID=UPI00188B1CE6|nr:hypothetical protein [Curtobacterium sp. VKM Ac-1393]MBF4607904.1 hypothetical protein [Curtobacterium sp. VKM Ac-1393]